jgi:uncharacterized protein
VASVDDPSPATTVAPLFPLPNGALLPGELLPLHVFEPRYRAMLEAVRKADRLIAIATLQPGWETDYHGTPAVAEVVGLGRVVKDRLNPDGTSDIVLHGLLRGEIVEEQPGRPFRRARLLLRGDGHWHAAEVYRLRRGLLTGIAERLRTRQLSFDLTAGFDVGALVDRIASALDITPEQRVEVLQALDLERRVELLLALLRDKAHRQQLLEIIPSLHAFSLVLGSPLGPAT